MSLDDFCQALALICNCWQWFDLRSDGQYWIVACVCDHGGFDIKTTFLEPQRELVKLYEAISDYHEELE